nr:T7-like capsid protein [uncultured Mediterranean phage uvMED]
MAQQATTATANGPIYGGANNGALTGLGTADQRRALYLKLFSGEMFKGFQHNTIARDLVTKRTLKGGRSMQFIYTGRTASEFHVPGQSILGNDAKTPPVAEKTIECDDLLISSAFVYELDETLAHYDLRGEISRKIGYALAENYDRRIFRAITKAARQPSPVSMSGFVEPGGSVVKVGAANSTTAADAYDSAKLIDAFYDAAAILDEKGVSGEGRVAVLNPRQYYALIQNVGTNGLINRDVQGTALQSGNGIIEIAGITIYKSMNIPFFGKFGTKTDMNPRASNDNEGSFVGAAMGDQDSKLTPSNSNTQKTINNYGTATKFANSCGLIFQKEAAGVVEAIGPQVQVTSGDISVVYQGDVILGRLAMGADFLNPACAVELVAGIDVSSNFNNTAVSNASFS